MSEWVPQLRDTVRFKDTSEASKWYTVRGVDDSDKTALILCTDGQQPLPGWVCWDMLELVDDAFTPAAIDQGARDQERFDAGYKAGYEAAQREWMRVREGGEDGAG